MIRTLHNVSSPTPHHKADTVSLRRPAHAGNFQQLLQPAGAGPSPSTGRTAPASQPAHLGPFTQMGFSAAPPALAAAYEVELPTPVPVPNSDLLSQPWDPHNPLQHEAVMNTWLEGYTQHANAQKVQIYQSAMADWQVNDARYRDLGLPAPPPPPAPVLDPVQPMPPGWWFKSGPAA